MNNKLIYSAITTPDGTILHSKHRHDYVSYTDTTSGETYFLDGGTDYQRRSVNTEPAIDLSVYMQDEHDLKRRFFLWKTYGKDGEIKGGKYIALKDMENEHIANILRYQQHIKGTYVEVLFLAELEYRGYSKAEIQELIDN